MRVALIDSDRERCGIREHSNLLKAAVTAADPSITFVPSQPEWLEPSAFAPPPGVDLVLINFHRALHSRWTPAQVQERLTGRCKVVVVFHDTYEVQPDRLPWELLEAADAMVVHEPCDLSRAAGGAEQKVKYWRQGVPEPDGTHGSTPRGAASRPFVGTCGFNFPWKGFDLLAEAAASVGWGVRILSHNATDADRARWTSLNPWADFSPHVNGTGYLPTWAMIAELAACDATAFLYQCTNSGTSAAIRLGIAAGKPLLATDGCRQFRDLQADHPATLAINWVEPSVEAVSWMLAHLGMHRWSTPMVALRERDSWRHLGKRYADLFRSLVS